MGNENFRWALMLAALDSRFCMKKLGFTMVQARGADVLLHRPVGPRDRRLGAGHRLHGGHLHQVPEAGGLRQVGELRLHGLLVAPVGQHQQRLLGAVECLADRGRVRHVAHHQVHARGPQVSGLGRVAHDGADAGAFRQQLPRGLAAGLARHAGQQDHIVSPGCPVLPGYAAAASFMTPR
jgi:hypothetical protein